MSPLDRLLGWLWDPRGRRRTAQLARQRRTDRKIRANQQVRRNALQQVQATQRFVARHRANWK